MKKRIASLLLAALLLACVGVTAYADPYNGQEGLAVEYDGEKLTPNYDASAFADQLGELQPGDDITFTIALINGDENDVDWWMNNKILESFEDTGAASGGGAYEYELTYVGPDGAEDVIYSSSIVGGEDTTAGEGLHEATGALEDFFHLGTMTKGQQGQIILKIALDGETQGNVYQSTVADLQMQFAVEPQADEPTPPVKTGDEMNLMPYLIASAASGLALLVIVAFRMKKSKQTH
ncbi:MAG: hypothetical protein E7426_02495 [Ruminococcaceae bacterium]|jgi:hypothetical protein|nr:hypothetical protein [Oscillospiraceae bacterium]